jgi:hypothetical protein
MSRRPMVPILAAALLFLLATGAAAQSPRWVQFSGGDYRLVDWATVVAIWFDNRNGTATIDAIGGAGGASREITDSAMIQRLRNALKTDGQARWIRVQRHDAPGGNPWDDPAVIEAYASLIHVDHASVVHAIDAPGEASDVITLAARSHRLGRVTDAAERARLLKLMDSGWP